MKFGVSMFATDDAIPPAELGRAVEERGFESLFFPEHTRIPSSRRSPWPGGADLPSEYYHCMDPFVAMASVFAVTKSLKAGPGICLVIERDPITLAKEVASLDHISGGRVLFGVGGGWNREEMENHGTDYTRRWKLLRERVEAMQAIWRDDEATYHGEFVNFDAIWSWPKPAQKPYPPILVGGNGARTLQRVIRYGDEWMPLGRCGMALGDRIQELQELAAKEGRAPIPVSISARPPMRRKWNCASRKAPRGWCSTCAPCPRSRPCPSWINWRKSRAGFPSAKVLKKANYNMWGNTAFANRKHRPHAPLFGVCYLISITPRGCSHTLKRVQGALLPLGVRGQSPRIPAGSGAKPPKYHIRFFPIVGTSFPPGRAFFARPPPPCKDTVQSHRTKPP